MGVSTTGANANARVTVDGTGAISDVTIMDGGSAYEVGDIISLVDVGTTAPSTPAVLRVQNTYNCIGECIEVGGVTRNESQAYDAYNTLYKITGVGIDNITVQSSDTIASFTTAGVGVTMTAKARSLPILVELLESLLSTIKQTPVLLQLHSVEHMDLDLILN